MKRLIVIMFCLFMAGCASVTEFTMLDDNGNPVKIIKATDTTVKYGDFFSTPTSRFGFLGINIGELAKLVTEFMKNEKANPVPVPQPTPNPIPTPIPQPTPNPTPTPQPQPTPPVFSTIFTLSGNTLTLDLDKLPDNMRKAGFDGSDNALYYAMAFIYAYGSGQEMPDDDAGSLVGLNTKREAILKWFDAEVSNVINLMNTNKVLELVAITNDGKDRCGFRLGPAIVERLSNAGLGSRSSVGETLDPKHYKPANKFLKLEKR